MQIQRQTRKTTTTSRSTNSTARGICKTGFCSCNERPKMRPPIQISCQERRSNGPKWTKETPCVLLIRESWIRNWETSQIPMLPRNTFFHPHLLPAQKASGVRKENTTYIGRMSNNGGGKRSVTEPAIAAAGFVKN